MRYGKSAGRLDINPTARRSPGQGLKKAAPGAPFGWCSSGTPYIGTQYAVKGTGSAMQFASLSTRNGAEQCEGSASHFIPCVLGPVTHTTVCSHATLGSLLEEALRPLKQSGSLRIGDPWHSRLPPRRRERAAYQGHPGGGAGRPCARSLRSPPG